jgi:exopolyphosphatase/guanosine-5'-triphosphate,3'-diphosphate pyrophosphatase
VSLPLGALPVEALLAEGAAAAKKKIDAMLDERMPFAPRPVFYAVGGGWRALAKAQMAAQGAPVQVVHGYSLATKKARDFAKKILRLSPAKLAAMIGVSERRLRTLPAAAMMLDRVLKKLAPERVVFSALGLREGYIYAQLDSEEQYLDPLIEGAQLIGLPGSRVPDFPPALAAWTEELFPARSQPRRGCASRSAHCRISPGAIIPISAPKRASAACCNFPLSASNITSGRSSPSPCMPVMSAERTRPISRPSLPS